MRYLLLFILIPIFWGCSKENIRTANVPNITESHRSLVSSSNDFGLELYKTLVKEEGENNNIIISPLSISTAISMVLNGAVGETELAILKALQLEGSSTAQNNQIYRDLIDYLPNVDKSTKAQIANSTWYDESFNADSSFLEVNKKYFDAIVRALDFSNPLSKGIINNWVAEATNNKIKEIIDEISPDHVMFLINAIYFNAAWADKFDKSLTKKAPFYLQKGGEVQVDMMYTSKIKFGYHSTSKVEVVSLPYGNKNFHFTAIIPKEGNTIHDIGNELNTADWNSWISNLKYDHGYHLEMPKFELNYKIELRKALDALGMGLAFSPGFADFSGISKDADLFISDINHKTYIKLDEEGTEAAAVTSVGVSVTSMPPVITIDRPYLIVIREEKTGALLFIGRIMNPLV